MNLIGEMSSWSYRRLLVFWWILFLLIQQTERFFLLPETLSVEFPSAGLLAKTLWVGLRADLITATVAVLVSAGVGALIAVPVALLSRRRASMFHAGGAVRTGLVVSSVLVGLVIGILLMVDMGYYAFNQHHLDFVFFEYVENLFVQTTEVGMEGAQAVKQTEAELQEGSKWGLRVSVFILLQLCVITAWWVFFTRALALHLSRWRAASPYVTNSLLVVAIVMGGVGFHHKGPEAIRAAEISSGTYYTLAQNPILYASEALRAALESRFQGGRPMRLTAMPVEDAVRVTQEVVGRGASYPNPQYPLVRTTQEDHGVRLGNPANVVIIFVEALDRRYLGQVIQGIRVTPFLDRLKDESVYFENFFSNGVQTSRGLFASLCSYYPRQGHAAMKNLYVHDYVCLPSLLRRQGYRTEMVISEEGDLNRLRAFVSRNGLHRLYDITDFPPEVKQIGSGAGLGKPDGALLDLVRTRIQSLQSAERPWFLATMTLGTHHPFAVPEQDPEIMTLQKHPDGYIAALRHLDRELERFFAELLRSGLLENTVVFILGDHGRHEVLGQNELEHQVGHFMAPLYVWMDESLRTPDGYRPRPVRAVASQVDLVPTILAMNGLMPRVSPFLGRDLSCLLQNDCLDDNFAFLTSVYDDLIGLVDNQGILLYSLRTGKLREVDLKLEHQAVLRSGDDPEVALRYRRLLALYVSSNVVLSRNAIWSWTELGGK
ncbi:MAG: LTA synthase family protein, partial [Nitrospiraceae bacterium]